MNPSLCLLVAAAVSAALYVHAEVPAFPGCEGAGKLTTGGRSGSLYVVTNLNKSGPGSFADAVSEPNRIVTFAVSGLIDLSETKKDKVKSGKLVIEKPDITVLGQTAPGEGICLKGGSLVVSASNVIIRYLRSRRGFVCDSDSGDAMEFKPLSTGIQAQAGGQTDERFQRRMEKKKERGKDMHTFAAMENIVLDHCSTSWATDENMTITHANNTSVSWCIAAEGLDYANPKQTPPNHSEGSLWGSAVANGRATMHHTLYAHNRLRNPRMTGGDDVPAVLTFYNNAVYDWSEYATHTGSERVLFQWLNNCYKPGPNTAKDIAGIAFGFHGDPGARIYASGNLIEGSADATKNNALAIDWQHKLAKLGKDERTRMISAQPFAELPVHLQPANEAFEAIIADAGATLPARDAVDWRILQSARDGTGHIIEKETDLPESQRWPEYHSLPPPADDDHDGLPDEWQTQFGVKGAMTVSDGYTNIEHYANNTDPTGGKACIVHVSASVSRASAKQAGEWRVQRTGDLSNEVTVPCLIDNKPVKVIIPTGRSETRVPLKADSTTTGRVATLKLQPSPGTKIGCPAQSLIVIQP